MLILALTVMTRFSADTDVVDHDLVSSTMI